MVSGDTTASPSPGPVPARWLGLGLGLESYGQGGAQDTAGVAVALPAIRLVTQLVTRAATRPATPSAARPERRPGAGAGLAATPPVELVGHRDRDQGAVRGVVGQAFEPGEVFGEPVRAGGVGPHAGRPGPMSSSRRRM